MMNKVLTVVMLSGIACSVECSLQDKITKAAVKINALRQDVKAGKDLEVHGPCGGSKCCGNSCGRCSKCHGR